MLTPVNDHEIRVYALMRSGYHAIIYWMIAHYPRKTVFLNSINFKGHPNRRKSWYFKTTTKGGSPLVRFHNPRWADSEELRAAFISLEDMRLPDVLDIWEDETHPWKKVGTSVNPHHNILVFRDPFNMLASRLVKLSPSTMVVTDPGPAIELYKIMLREARRETTYLDNPVVAVYNDWFRSLEYRKELGDLFSLRGPFTKPFQRVSTEGGGSSFDQFKKQGAASQMGVLGRWKKYVNHKFMKMAANDDELLDLCKGVLSPHTLKEIDLIRKVVKQK